MIEPFAEDGQFPATVHGDSVVSIMEFPIYSDNSRAIGSCIKHDTDSIDGTNKAIFSANPLVCLSYSLLTDWGKMRP